MCWLSSWKSNINSSTTNIILRNVIGMHILHPLNREMLENKENNAPFPHYNHSHKKLRDITHQKNKVILHEGSASF